MAKGQIHLTDNGPEICRADPSKAKARGCPFESGGHFGSMDEAQTAFAVRMESEHGGATFRKPRTPKNSGFSLEDGGFYGDMPPRSIQIDALNATAEALLEDGNTQLVAACGTGKSYMGRQLMRRMMDEEDANGVAIVLTSSVKLAVDTAADLKPDPKTGFYDRAIGEYGSDYEVEVIEVHHESKDIKEDGAISTQKIADKWKKALDEGKKVIIVSTYQSSDKVQQVQALIGERAQADLLMNDEAHNILGQKKSVSSGEEAENSGYRSFADEIPGAIQAKHRLYATATPPLADSPDDEESSAKGGTKKEQLAALTAQAKKMNTNGKERITIYSDDEHIVGKVSGAITQQTAIAHGYLTQPEYQLRAALVKGNPMDSPGGFVDHTGRFVAAPAPEGSSQPRTMTAQTYSAVSSTLQAMVAEPTADADGKLKNPVHNALAYAGSIDQAKAFRDNFRTVALEQSGGMELSAAEASKDSSDPELRRRARMRLLAEHGEAVAAYSGETKEAKDGRKKAFSMFQGSSFTAEDAASGWSPHKKVLANVDIFSEGISINEIDTVIISDQSKTSERAMTQAIGRSLRTVGDNPHKTTGHVIIPQVMGENGKELNGGFITAATYGATRVERAVSTKKLRGEAVPADEITQVARYSHRGEHEGSTLAASIAKTHVKSTEDLIASQAIERADSSLRSIPRGASPIKRAGAESYRKASKAEQAELQRSFIASQSVDPQVKDSTWAVAHSALSNVSNSDMATVRQSGRVVTAALSAGDFSAVPDSMISGLTRAGIIRSRRGSTDEPTANEKMEFLSGTSGAAALALGSPFARSIDPEIAAQISEGVNFGKAGSYAASKRGSSEDYDRLVANYEKAVRTVPKFRDRAFDLVARSSENPSKGSQEEKIGGLLDQWSNKLGFNVGGELENLRGAAKSRSAAAASSGQVGYELDPSMVSKNGTLKAPAQKKLADLI